MTATLVPADRVPGPAPTAPARRSRGELGALAALLAGTAVLYLWNLGASGYANSFYAAAVQAGTKSWEALLFGSLDSHNVITVDKPPAALWIMSLSGRIFGFSSWSMLVPQALMGVATVALVYAAVRRISGPAAGLLAGAVMALTPVAVLMFRFNNPDALLVLLMVGAAYATVRAIEKAGTRWLVLAGVLIGLGFLSKMGQALIVVPGLALAYLVCAPTGLWRRIWQLLLAGVAIVVSAGWYVALVEIWPAGSRPYIGGSEGNSLLQLAIGYNGLGRIFGNERGFTTGGAGGGLPAGFPAELPAGFPAELPGGFPGADAAGGFAGGGPGGFGGATGITRLFSTEIGGQISWLLPAALALLVAGLWITRRAPRTDRTRASLLLWGGWTVVTLLVFSYAAGTFHPYYTVALAPGIAALVGIGGAALWRRRASWPGRAALAVIVAGTAAWAWVLLGRSTTFLPWLRWVVVALAVLAVIALLVPMAGRRWAGIATLVVVLSGAAGPAAYAVDTAATPHMGSIPSAGPSTGTGGFGAGGFGGAAFGRDGDGARGDRDGARVDGGTAGTAPGAPGGITAPGGAAPGGTSAPSGGGLPAGGPGEETTDPALVTLLKNAGTTWAAATTGAQSQASLALASDTDVIAIGGFVGSDPAPTLAQFQSYVAAGDVHYYVEGGMGGGGFGRSSEIGTWVQQNFTATTVGGRTVYDLTAPS